MNVGANLLTLKREAQAAVTATVDRELKDADRWVLAYFAGCILVIGGFLVFAAGVTALISLVTHLGDPVIKGFGAGTAYTTGGALIVAVGVYVFKTPSSATSRDSEWARLKVVQDTAYVNYKALLESEMSTYGIDVETISARNNYMDTDYAFTALRNGNPIDVNVREFNDEIVFMLNGERMKKSVTV